MYWNAWISRPFDFCLFFAGFVTTARVTHATPASLYAHSADRDWEAETLIKKEDTTNCNDDIAKQLIESQVGKDIKVSFLK